MFCSELMKPNFTVFFLFPILFSVVLTFSYQTYPLPSGVVGPESFAFDCNGEGPYTGVSDGRILKWEGTVRGWEEFAVPDRYRRDLCDGSSDSEHEPICGRPLGLQFNNLTCELYIADSYFGLMIVGSKHGDGGGVATTLASSAEGVPFRFTNALDIDQETGAVYFTDSSTIYQRKDNLEIVQNNDSTGRFMRYDPRSREVTVLLRGLAFANGVALSKDNTYVLVAETSKFRIQRHWLKGSRANSTEIFGYVPGGPDNVRRNSKGEFWVGLNNGQNTPSFRDEIIAVRLDSEGRVVEKLHGNGSMTAISEVYKHKGILFVGSVVMPFVGVSTLHTPELLQSSKFRGPLNAKSVVLLIISFKSCSLLDAMVA